MPPIPSKFRDWASMARLPNVPTVWSNVFTAWVLAGGVWATAGDGWILVGSLLGGTFLYVAGTMLCEVVDVEFDRRHRPERPIPSARVHWKRALLATLGCFGLGFAAFFAVHAYGALVLFMAILFYAKFHKLSPRLAIVFMASCRACLALTVACVVNLFFWQEHPWLCFWIGALFAYIGGISWTALGESRPIRRKAVGWLLALLPLLDAVFLAMAGRVEAAMVPLACLPVVCVLRQVAAAT